MTTTISSLLSDPHSFEQQKALVPSWLHPLKDERWAEYLRLPTPSRKDESWRFSSLKALDVSPYRLAPGNGILHQDPLIDLPADKVHRIRIVNDQVVESIAPDDLPAGAVVLPFQQAWETHPTLLREYLYVQRPGLGSDKIAALHNALNSNGVLIFLPDGVSLEKPVWIDYSLTENLGAVFPYTLIVTGKGCRVSVVEHFYSDESVGSSFACGATHLYAGEASDVSYLGLQRWNRQSLSFQLNTVEARADSRVKNLVLQLGSQRMRHENHSRITGRGAHVDMFSLSIANEQQELDQRTLQDHCAPGSISDLLYKNALSDKARTIFSGLIKVEKEAQQTDAYQTNRNLLLSDDADAVSMPGLEILANDVKCSHGATSGQVDDSELFYMLSRGLPPLVARQLLVTGFLDELLQKIEQPELQEIARNLMEQRLLS